MAYVTITTTPKVGNFLLPTRRLATPLLDYSFGGADLTGVTRDGYVWSSSYDAGVIRLGIVDQEPQFSLAVPDVSWLSFSFDQLMRPAIVYIRDGGKYLYWYDPIIPGYTTTELDSGVVTPFLEMDDPRPDFVALSDVILTYVREGNIYCRVQRDRYAVERALVTTGTVSQLRGFGRTDILRLNWRYTTTA